MADAKRYTWIDHTSELGAPVAEVEALLRDIDGWPTWTPGLRAIWRRRATPIDVGARFVMLLSMKGPPVPPLPSVVMRMEPGLLEWGGGVGSAQIRHSFTLEADGDGRCRARHVEYATGWLGAITRPMIPYAHAHDAAWSLALEARFPR